MAKKATVKLTREKKRELGILPRQIVGKVRELAKSGIINKSMSANEIALFVYADIASEPGTHDNWDEVLYGSPDWDAFFAFIEKIVALVLRLLPLFI